MRGGIGIDIIYITLYGEGKGIRSDLELEKDLGAIGKEGLRTRSLQKLLLGPTAYQTSLSHHIPHKQTHHQQQA